MPMGPGGIIEVPEDMQKGVSRLVDMSVACRYLAAQCQVRQGNWADATEMLGEANPFRNSGRSGPAIPNLDGGIKIEASMCNLRGILMLKLNRGDQAKQCFMEALALDVKCFDAFEQLVSGEMMTPDEGTPVFGFLSAASNMRRRMGVRSGPSVLVADAARRVVRAAHLHRAAAEIQTRDGACAYATAPGRGVRSW